MVAGMVARASAMMGWGWGCRDGRALWSGSREIPLYKTSSSSYFLALTRSFLVSPVLLPSPVLVSDSTCGLYLVSPVSPTR